MEYFIRSGGQGTDDDLAQIVLKLVCNFDYKKRGKNTTASKGTATKKSPVIAPHFSGFRMLATGVEARLTNNITLTKISGKGHTMMDYFVMQNRKTFSFDYQRKVVGWNYFADARLFLNLTGGHFNQVQVTGSHVASVKVADSDKLMESIKRSAKYMPGELYEQVKALLTPEAIAGMAAFGATYVASQLTPVGWIADALVAVMFIGGVIFMGTELIEVGKLLIKFYETATNASSDAQYDEAGKYFAEAVIKVGVDVIITIIFHKATKAVDRKIIKVKSNSGGGGGGNGSGKEVGRKKGTEFEKPKEEESKPKTPKVIKKYKDGWSQEKVLAIEKGKRPSPSTYLTEEYIADYKAKFEKEGGSFIVVKSWTEGGNPKYTTLPERKFVGLKSEMDAVIAKYEKSGKDWKVLRDELNLGKDVDLSLDEIHYVTVKPNDPRFKFEMPDGNERGAIDGEWVPGGHTKSGTTEAALVGAEKVDHGKKIENLLNIFGKGNTKKIK